MQSAAYAIGLQPSGTSAGGSGSPVVESVVSSVVESVVVGPVVVSGPDVVGVSSVVVPSVAVDVDVVVSSVVELPSVVVDPEPPQPAARSSPASTGDARDHEEFERRRVVMLRRS